jgi:hypothetical protein
MNWQTRKNVMRLSRLALVTGVLFLAIPSWCDAIFPDTVTGLHCSGSLAANYACNGSSGLYFGTNRVLLRPLVGFRQNNFSGYIVTSSFTGSTFTGTFAGDEYLYNRCGRWTCVQIYAVTGTFSGNWNGKWNSHGTVSLDVTQSTLIKTATVPEPGTFAFGLTGLLAFWRRFRTYTVRGSV